MGVGMRPRRLTDETVEHYTRTGLWGCLTWGEYIDQNARLYPEKPAIIDRSGVMSCSELGRVTDCLARSFLELGVTPGGVVALQLPNWWEYIACRFALSKIGAVIAPFNIALRGHDVEYLVKLTAPQAIVTPSEWRGTNYLAMVDHLRGSNDGLIHVVVDEAVTSAPGRVGFYPLTAGVVASGELESYRPDPNELDFLSATSGTTQGITKLAMRTHNAYLAMTHQYISTLRITHKDVSISPAPITQAIGANCYNIQAVTSAPVVELERFDVDAALAAIEAHRPTFMFCVPTHMVDILNSPRAKTTDFSSMERVLIAGSSVPPELAQAVEELMGVRVLIAYGSIDTSAATCVTMDDPPEKRYFTVGRPSAGNEVAVVGTDGAFLGPGEVGEVGCRGPNGSLGYFNDPQADEAVFRADGYGMTGDLGRLDKEGYLQIVGRSKDIIIRGGQNIVPMEVERVLRQHPDVRDVAVIGVPDPRLGEVACACVVPHPGKQLTLAVLTEFLRQAGLAPYKLPERLLLLASLPLSAGDKVARNVLREMATAEELEARPESRS